MSQRKLIAHGPSSLTVALPFKWVRKHSLKKGDVIDVSEQEEGLFITSKPSQQKKEISIDIKGLDLPSIAGVLTTVYRRGYDHVKVKYKTPREYQGISSSLRSLLGFAIIEHSKNICHIKCLPSELEQDFKTLFRRVFLILLQQMEDLKELIGDKKALKVFYRRDADLNAVVNIAIRMVNKGYVHDRFEELHLFHALLVLEEAGDDLSKFTIELQRSKNPEALRPALHKTQDLLRLLYDAYFKKKIGVDEFYKQYYVYWPDYEDKVVAPLYEFFRKKVDLHFSFYMRSMVEKIIDLAEVLLLSQE